MPNWVSVRAVTYYRHSQVVESVTLFDGTRYELQWPLDAQGRAHEQSTELVVRSEAATLYSNFVFHLQQRRVDVDALADLGFTKVIE